MYGAYRLALINKVIAAAEDRKIITRALGKTTIHERQSPMWRITKRYMMWMNKEEY